MGKVLGCDLDCELDCELDCKWDEPGCELDELGSLLGSELELGSELGTTGDELLISEPDWGRKGERFLFTE